MTYKLSEQRVLKKLGIEDFRHLTKAKVIRLASMLDKMDPEVAKKALDQFPEFAKTSKEMLLEYKDTLDKELKSNDDSIREVYVSYSAIIESLQKELDKPDLSFEEKKYIIEQMKDVADKVDKKDTENKRWLAGMATLAGAVALGFVATLASSLGGNTHIEANDYDEDEDPNV